ncbi:MAG: hypothetical protein AAF684_12295, partial [Pseudomonadota bacterium]
MLTLLPHRKSYVAFTHDVLAAAAAYVVAVVAAFWIRADQPVAVSLTQATLIGAAVQAGLGAVLFVAFRLYAGVWRYASIPDLMQILKATLLLATASPAVTFLVTRLADAPRSALILNAIILFVFLAGPRVGYRVWRDRGRSADSRKADAVPTLLIGATDAAETFIREMRRGNDAPYTVVGILDDRDRRVGRAIHTVPILGPVSALERVVERLQRRGNGPQRIILAGVETPPAELEGIMRRADDLGLTVARLPRVTDFRDSTSVQAGVR